MINPVRIRLHKIAYWIGIISISFLVVVMLAVVLLGFFVAYNPLPEGLADFLNGLFGLFASIIMVILTVSINAYFKNRGEKSKHKLEMQQKRIKPYCAKLQKLMDLVRTAKTIKTMTVEQKQQEREVWMIEWNTTWKETRPLISDLNHVSNDECRSQLDSAFGIIHKHVNDLTGNLQEIETTYKLVMQKCDGCEDSLGDNYG